MTATKLVFRAFLAIFSFLPLANGRDTSEPNPEEIIKEFLGTNPSNGKLIDILKKGTGEPYKTKIIERIMAQSPVPEEASEVLAQKPTEPYASQAWKIVETSGSLRGQCYVLSSASEEYQDKAFALISNHDVLIEEYNFYIMQSAPPQRFIKPIWEGFMKLNPTKENLFSVARTAKGGLKEIAVLFLFNQKLTALEFESVMELISEAQKESLEKREEKLIEIITRKQCP